MRALLVAALAAGFALAILSDYAAAQPRAETAQRANPRVAAPRPPDVGFRPRTAAERLAVARQLAARAQPGAQGPATPTTAIQLGESFVLTPRVPYVQNRGALTAHNVVYFWPEIGDAGIVWLAGTWNQLTLALNVSGPARLLIECTVSGDVSTFTGTLRRLSPSSTIWSHPTIRHNNRISYLTPWFTNAREGQVKFEIEPANMPNGIEPSWLVTGCEVTRLLG